MKAFHQLTSKGQIRRYHQMARVALDNYPITVNKLGCLSIRHNVMFRVDAREGQFILRIGYPGIRTRLMVESEMRWLDDMREAQIELNISYPVQTKTGVFVTESEIAGIPEKRQIVLLSYLPGQLINESPSTEKLYRFGKALAQLHRFSEDYSPAQAFMSFDNFRCDEWGGIDYLNEAHPLLPENQKSLFREAIVRSENALEQWRKREGLRLIHADLHLKNANWYRSDIGIFDFDDCRWGHRLQDWGVILATLKEKSDENDKLKAALIEGYQSKAVLTYSEQELSMAVLHRLMWGLTFVINHRPLKRQNTIDSVYQWLEKHFPG